VLLSSLAKTNLPTEIKWKLDHLFPIICAVGSFFPSLAQAAFARIHVDDVVARQEASFVKEMFIKEASFAHFYSVMRRIRIVSVLDIITRVQQIKTESLIVYGEDDHFTKKDSMILHDLLAHSRLQGMPGGHLPHLTSPKLFATHVLDFL
jgi:pimeloyl-ACP methyl ester carboxylesterase